MGDRAVIQIEHNEWRGHGSSVALYSHSYGISLLSSLQEAMSLDIARNRWGDASYLTRIIFQFILDKDGLDEFGFGIMPGNDDGQEYDLMQVDVAEQRVNFGEDSWSFEEFVNEKALEEYVNQYWVSDYQYSFKEWKIKSEKSLQDSLDEIKAQIQSAKENAESIGMTLEDFLV